MKSFYSGHSKLYHLIPFYLLIKVDLLYTFLKQRRFQKFLYHRKQVSKNIFVVVVISEGKFKQFGLSNYSAWEVVSV